MEDQIKVGDLVVFRSEFAAYRANREPLTGVVVKVNPSTSFGDTCIVYWTNNCEAVEYIRMLQKKS